MEALHAPLLPTDTSASPASTNHHGRPAQRCQRAWGSSWEKLEHFGQIWNFHFCLFLKSAVTACGKSLWGFEQDYGSVILHRARPRVCMGEVGRMPAGLSQSSLLLSDASPPLGQWLTAWRHPAHRGRITNRREATLGLQRTRNKEWVHQPWTQRTPGL